MTIPLSITHDVNSTSSIGSTSSSLLSHVTAAAGQRNGFISSKPSSLTPSTSLSFISSGCENNQPSTTSTPTVIQDAAAPERTMGLMSAILMIIGTLIGTGIFASPGPLFDSVKSTQTSFMIWAFAGIICIIGAFAYAELGTMFPESGGDFQYLARAYGKKMALVFGWSFITILNPIGTAGIAGVLGRYSVDVITYIRTGTSVGIGGAGASEYERQFNGSSVLNGTGYGVPHIHSPFAPGTPAYDTFPTDSLTRDHTGAVLLHADEMPWVVRAFSIGAIVVMGLINILFKEGGKYASNILAIFKILGMFMLIVIGSIQAVKNHAHSEALSIPIKDSSQNVLDYVSALCFAFFAYNGFNNINLGLGELRDPERNLKRAVWIAMPFVTILFLLANFAFFSILSSYDLRHVHSLSLHAGHTVLGKPGGFLMAGTVIASALGSINANIWAGSRLLVIMAKDNAIVPFPVGRIWTRTGTQALAITILIGQAAMHALINLDFKTFSKIYSAVGWSWYGLSILGLLWLRKKSPSYPRPVKVYWPLAAFFVAVAFFLVIGSLTLAFMGSSQEPGNGDEAGHGSGRYKSVIMFGMAILFMLGVVPAFFLTRCYNRRRACKHSSVESTSGISFIVGDEGDSNCGHSDTEISRRRGQNGEVMPGSMERKGGLEVRDDRKLMRRHSGASSITLVGESKKKKDQRDKRRQGHSQQEDGALPGTSRSQSRQSDHDDENDKEMDRIQALRSASHDSLDQVELGAASTMVTESSNTVNYLSPIGPSGTCFSPSTTSTCDNDSIPNSPNEPDSHFLGLPRDFRFGSRSSETTLGLGGDYVYETDDREKGLDATEENVNPEDRREGIEELEPRRYFLDIPATEGSISMAKIPSYYDNHPPILNGEISGGTSDEQRTHPLVFFPSVMLAP